MADNIEVGDLVERINTDNGRGLKVGDRDTVVDINQSGYVFTARFPEIHANSAHNLKLISKGNKVNKYVFNVGDEVEVIGDYSKLGNSSFKIGDRSKIIKGAVDTNSARAIVYLETKTNNGYDGAVFVEGIKKVNTYDFSNVLKVPTPKAKQIVDGDVNVGTVTLKVSKSKSHPDTKVGIRTGTYSDTYFYTKEDLRKFAALLNELADNLE